jgi:DNA gyrase/topoisomerase IV subunit A
MRRVIVIRFLKWWYEFRFETLKERKVKELRKAKKYLQSDEPYMFSYCMERIRKYSKKIEKLTKQIEGLA